MNNDSHLRMLNRRDLLRLSTAGATALGAKMAFPGLTAAASQTPAPAAKAGLYEDLLRTWCDGVLTHQVAGFQGRALHGALLCPSCAMIHGRCGDAVYPLMHMAHTTGDEKYLKAALLVNDWTERQVSQADGSWINDVTLSAWKGITVFHTIALAETLHHHGTILDAKTRERWTDRLARAAKFLDGFMTIETGNINYPITGSYCFALCAEVLGDSHYGDRGRKLAHAVIEYFTPKGLIFGEGHPLHDVTPKGCQPVDLGYNVEESLPSLALYSLLTKDKAVLDQTIIGLRAHMEFMLPDGAWDNSWGTRNYKWTWWGSRTSDGCQAAYALLADHDPRFREVARRSTELMASCTHEGLLYGGPDYFAHGDLPCIHHTFTHAKALATVIDRGGAALTPDRPALPRDEAYGLKFFPEISTQLIAIGDWRATVTGYDWEYVEHVQAGGAGAGGGHASGGALSVLVHRKLGNLLTASMTEYQMIEISNQQAFRDYPHMPLTPRIECAGDLTYTSLSDLAAVVKTAEKPGEISLVARGRLLTASHQPLPTDTSYHLVYRLMASGVEITANVIGAGKLPAPLRFILPVICRSSEAVELVDAQTIRITKPGGVLIVRSMAGFEAVPSKRTFNLIPGFECVPLAITMQPGKEITIRLEAA